MYGLLPAMYKLPLASLPPALQLWPTKDSPVRAGKREHTQPDYAPSPPLALHAGGGGVVIALAHAQKQIARVCINRIYN